MDAGQDLVFYQVHPACATEHHVVLATVTEHFTVCYRRATVLTWARLFLGVCILHGLLGDILDFGLEVVHDLVPLFRFDNH